MFCKQPEEHQKLSEYKVTVRTGEYRWAGTNSLVQIIVVGDIGVTKMHKLDNSGVASLRTALASGDDRERGDTRKYSFEDINVGNIEYISLFLDKTLEVKDYWYVEYVNVRRFGKDGKDGKSFAMFPMHSWITEDHEKVVLRLFGICLD